GNEEGRPCTCVESVLERACCPSGRGRGPPSEIGPSFTTRASVGVAEAHQVGRRQAARLCLLYGSSNNGLATYGNGQAKSFLRGQPAWCAKSRNSFLYNPPCLRVSRTRIYWCFLRRIQCR